MITLIRANPTGGRDTALPKGSAIPDRSAVCSPDSHFEPWGVLGVESPHPPGARRGRPACTPCPTAGVLPVREKSALPTAFSWKPLSEHYDIRYHYIFKEPPN